MIFLLLQYYKSLLLTFLHLFELMYIIIILFCFQNPLSFRIKLFYSRRDRCFWYETEKRIVTFLFKLKRLFFNDYHTNNYLTMIVYSSLNSPFLKGRANNGVSIIVSILHSLMRNILCKSGNYIIFIIIYLIVISIFV